MRITMAKAEELIEALDNLTSAIENVGSPLEEWRDLDGETDADSRDQRRDAREAAEDGIDELRTAVEDACGALGIKLAGG